MGNDTSVHPLPDDLQSVVDNFYIDLKAILIKHHDATEEFLCHYEKWAEKRNAVISALTEIIDDIEKHHNNSNIASLSGSSVSLVGGAACIAGLVFAPVTAGLSTVLSFSGILGTSAGTLAMAGSKLVEFGLKKDALRKACALVEDDCEETLQLTSIIEKCQMHEDDIKSFLENSNCIEILRRKSISQLKRVKNESLKRRLERIKSGDATGEDCIVLLSFFASGNFDKIKHLQGLRSVKFNSDLVRSTFQMCHVLRGSVSNIRKCALILRNWKTGTISIHALSKVSRFAKGAVLGLSMITDVYDIGSTVKDMILRTTPEEVMQLRNVVIDLKAQQNDISKYYDMHKFRLNEVVDFDDDDEI